MMKVYIKCHNLRMETLTVSMTIMVISALIIFDDCSGQRRDLSFSIATQYWYKDNFILVEDSVKLLCTTNTASSTIEIRRSDDGKQLVTSHGRELSLEYTIRGVMCHDAGTYVCVVDNVWNKTLDIGVHDCPPRPCEVNDVNKTIFVHLHQTVQFSLCVLAYPDIQEVIQFNNTLIRQKHIADWTWDYEKRPLNTGASQIHINVSSVTMVSELYGVLNIRVFSRSGVQYYLDYNIFIQPPGPPKCPRKVKVRDQGLSYIRLSWIPGSDGGVIQSFHVYSSEDNVTWDTHDVTHGETTLNVSDLQENTSYCFRVASSNDVRPAVNEFVCQNTICGQTFSRMRPAATVKSPDLSSKGAKIILQLVLVAGIFGMFGFAVGFLTHWYRRSGREDKSRNMAFPPNGHDLPCTHYEEIRDVISNLPDNSEGSTNPEVCCLELLVKRPGRSSQDDDVPPPHTHYITPASETSDSERYVNLARS